MARSKSDISNSAIRIFLQEVGKFYDETRGFEPFTPRKSQKDELLKAFDYKCCFCHEPLNVGTLSQDHLVPMNKTSLGLHAWGNVVPCCRDCNSEKQQRPWKEFTLKKADVDGEERVAKIESYVESMYYDPDLDLHEYAGNLYEDVGQVALTLINLRYRQAEEGIRKLLGYGEVVEDGSIVSPDKFDDDTGVDMTPAVEIDWLRKLRSVGLEAFVSNYELLEAYSRGARNRADSIELLVNEGVGNESGASIRLGNAKRIFESGSEQKALKHARSSSRVSEAVRVRAEEILANL